MYYHFTDDPDFKLDPNKVPTQEVLGEPSLGAGIYVTPDPNYHYRGRHHRVEIDSPDDLETLSGDQVGKGVGGEVTSVFVPASNFTHLQAQPRKRHGILSAMARTPLQKMTLPLTDLIAQHADMQEVLDSGRASDTPDSPIYVKPSPVVPGKWEIADGHHRVAEAIRNGKTHIEALAADQPDDEPYEGPFYDFSQHMKRNGHHLGSTPRKRHGILSAQDQRS